jgi:hypothetical protein
LMVELPTPVVRVMMPPLRVTVPSWKSRPEAVWLPRTLTVKEPVALAPAEKTACWPEVQAAVAAVPSARVLQKLPAPQVPAAVLPDEAPLAEPLMSQYRCAAAEKARPNANKREALALQRAEHITFWPLVMRVNQRVLVQKRLVGATQKAQQLMRESPPRKPV